VQTREFQYKNLSRMGRYCERAIPRIIIAPPGGVLRIMRPGLIVWGQFRKVAECADSGGFVAAAERMFPCLCCLEGLFVGGLVDPALRGGMVMRDVLAVLCAFRR
jgi:hypothetical protein